MKVKYYSEDGHEFNTKQQCSKYEEEIKKLEKYLKENNDKEYEKLLSKVSLNDAIWYKIDNTIDFYIFDHKDDTEEKISDKSFYDIFNIVRDNNLQRSFPIWITLQDGNPINNKKLIGHYQDYISELQNFIKEKKDEIKQLKNLDELLESESTEEPEEPEESNDIEETMNKDGNTEDNFEDDDFIQDA